MAQLVTRSMTTTTVIFKAADTANDKLVERTAVIPRKVESSKVLEVIKDSYDYVSSGIIPVAVVSCNHTEKLYGMTQDEFFKYARELDDKRKFINNSVVSDPVKPEEKKSDPVKLEDKKTSAGKKEVN